MTGLGGGGVASTGAGVDTLGTIEAIYEGVIAAAGGTGGGVGCIYEGYLAFVTVVLP